MASNHGQLHRDLIGGTLTINGKLVIDSETNLFAKNGTFTRDLLVKGNITASRIFTTDYVNTKIDALNDLRVLNPNSPTTLGSSTALQAEEYLNMPFQAGLNSNNLKFEYNSAANKYSLPGLAVTATFDLVPSTTEAGSYESEILDCGYDTYDRTQNAQWYGVTQDDTYFYYGVWGNAVFSNLFGSGASTLYVCRRKADASLVWCKSQWNYSIDIPKQALFTGTTLRIARVALGIHKGRLYACTMLTNIGPQLYCLDAATGDPIWSMAYELPDQLQADLGVNHLVSPSTPLNSFDGSSYAGQCYGIGDLNVICADLEDTANVRTSVFVGVSSYQNAVNAPDFTGFPVYTDQGKLIRIDDLGTTATRVWEANMCGEKLVIGNVISSSGADEYNPFRPGNTSVLIWRDTTDVGTFADAGNVIGQVMDYSTPAAWPTYVPGYKPYGWPSSNNQTMPIVSNILIVGNTAPFTESSVPNVWRSTGAGIGANPVIYENGNVAPQTITTRIGEWNSIQAGLSPGQYVKKVIWTYLNQTEVDAVDAAAWGNTNAGVRYVAALPDGYTITNEQEAHALNYYGNSVWGNMPVIDIKRGLAYCGTGQAHACPLDEDLFYQDPNLEYYTRKQAVIDTIYQYSRLDDSTIGAPISTLGNVITAKETFIADTTNLNLNYVYKSPRGNQAYSDSIMGVDLYSGNIVFGARIVPWDALTFVGDDPYNLVITTSSIDADASSGIQFFDRIVEADGYKTKLATQHKGSIFTTLDISGLNPEIQFNHQNLLEKGVTIAQLYSGPDSILGGSNYGLTQDGGSQVIFVCANNASFGSSKSVTYDTGYYGGYELHVTNDGRTLPVKYSFAAAVDVSKNALVWETNLGETTHTVTGVYNGVVFLSRGDGLLYGLDVADGKLIWSLDGNGLYGLGGCSTCSFAQGQGVWISNFPLPFGGAKTQLGNTGLLLNVDNSLILTPSDTILSLLGSHNFTSYDVTPKKAGAAVNDALIDDQTVTHAWSTDGTTVTAAHTKDSVTTNITVSVDNYVFSSKQITFTNYPTTMDIRYVSLRFLNKQNYILNYQLLESGVWVNYAATFRFTSLTPAISFASVKTLYPRIKKTVKKNPCGVRALK